MMGKSVREWDNKKTDETREIEAKLRPSFPNSEAYRFNSASIRVRIIDRSFDGKDLEQREVMVMPLLEKLPKKTRNDILMLLLATPQELGDHCNTEGLLNLEFEHPPLSRL
jgi:hypothetical protein